MFLTVICLGCENTSLWCYNDVLGPVAQLVEQRIEKTATFGYIQRTWQLQHEVKKVCFTLCDFFSQIPNFSKIQNLIA